MPISTRPARRIERVDAAAYRIPTDRPEGDGTYTWDSTTLITVSVASGDVTGFGYTYGSASIVPLIRRQLAPRLIGFDAYAVEAAWNALAREVRNIGRPGIASTAISALDTALWDLKATLLGLPLVTLLGSVRDCVPIYGSGGFTTYSVAELSRQLTNWVEDGITHVKMKIGMHPYDDIDRVKAARHAIGEDVTLMVDANGAYKTAQAIRFAHAFAESDVRWFEEPVSSDDLEGLRAVHDRAPVAMAVAAGEYGYDPIYFRRMLAAGAVHVLQADATRCLGVTGFLAASRLSQAFDVPLSAHTAPSLHAHLGCACTPLMHVEYFHDHVRIEEQLFDGFIAQSGGVLRPDRSRPGLGIALKRADADRYAVAA
ncbi:MAG TPA: enolase C-terminal domain-like protein [Vicinamibacterales bacterium]